MSYRPPFRVSDLGAEIDPIGPVAIGPDASVLTALETMATHNIGSVLVMEGETLLGIYTERDYARKGELCGRSAAKTPIADVMTKGVVTIGPQALVAEVLSLMREKDIRHIPVVDGGVIQFVISNKAILRAFAENKAFWDTTMRDFGAFLRT
jgi:CBS domain-containing protein